MAKEYDPASVILFHWNANSIVTLGDHRYTGITTALWGGVFLVIADTLARLVNPAHELPVGVLTSLLGGGLFIYLINRKRGKVL
mgnify:CR=1 FL=1